MANKTDLHDEPLIPHEIPDNFADSGRVINGMFKTRNLIEALILGVPLGLIFWFLLYILPGNWRFTISIFFAACGFAAGINGVQGDTVFEFIQHVLFFNRRKRYTLYNDRVKKEFKADYMFKDKQKNQMDELVDKFRNTILGENNDDYNASDIVGSTKNVIFEDNMSVVGTPDELKSKKQLRAEAKERKRLDREAERIRRENERHQFLIQQAGNDRLRELRKRDHKNKRK